MVQSSLQVSQNLGMFLYGPEVERAPLRSGLWSGFSEKALWVWEPGSSPVCLTAYFCLLLASPFFPLMPESQRARPI